DKNDILEIVRLVEERRPNLNLRLIGCALSSTIMAANAVTTGELPIAPIEMTPGGAHTALRALPGLRWLYPGANKLTRWRELDGNPGPGPRFSSFSLDWNVAESWLNSQGLAVKIVALPDTPPHPVTEAVVRSELDAGRALVFFNKSHWRLITKCDYNGPGGAMRIWVSDPGGTGKAEWLTLQQASARGALIKYRTLQFSGSSGYAAAQPEDLEASAAGAQRILVTGPAGRKAGVDPATGQQFGDDVAGVVLNPSMDSPDSFPQTAEEEAAREAESITSTVMNGVLPEGTYTIDVDRADTVVRVAWRESGQRIKMETFTPAPTPWGGRVTMRVWTGTPCAGDINHDGVVNGADLTYVLAQWGAAGSADIDGSGVVGGSDLGALLTAWGPCH
ncbi:MAG: hypothetical protein EBU31_15850, partial [Proteobacteria bacterium]|nr:hypothetical protein [Pseudomonadota bacterium]